MAPGPRGGGAADDLRLLAVGKGAEGERAAREYLIGKGLEDVLPAGVVSDGAAAGDGLLGAATRATDPFLARGALTGGERAFDLAAGTAGGVAGAATADEDAMWQERAGRFALGSAAGALGGANLRQLGRVASGTLADDALGVAAGRGRGSGQTPTPNGLTKLGALTQAVQAVPLMSPRSLATNAVAGGFRLLQRYGQDTAGNLDRPGESVADLLGMFRALPDALAAAKREMGGLTQQGGRGQGIAPAGLFESTAPLARFLTSGTRANAATDQFYRTLAEGGARARQEARGVGGTADARRRRDQGRRLHLLHRPQQPDRQRAGHRRAVGQRPQPAPRAAPAGRHRRRVRPLRPHPGAGAAGVGRVRHRPADAAGGVPAGAHARRHAPPGARRPGASCSPPRS